MSLNLGRHAESGSRSRSASFSSISVQFVRVFIGATYSRPVLPGALISLDEILQLVAQCLVSTKEQRLGRRLAQLQNLTDLL